MYNDLFDSYISSIISLLCGVYIYIFFWFKNMRKKTCLRFFSFIHRFKEYRKLKLFKDSLSMYELADKKEKKEKRDYIIKLYKTN